MTSVKVAQFADLKERWYEAERAMADITAKMDRLWATMSAEERREWWVYKDSRGSEKA